MFKFKGKWVVHEVIQSLVTDNVCFNIQKCKENLKKSTFDKKKIFSEAKGKFLKEMKYLKDAVI